ncbi:MAG TPA: hypothetical protein EYG86_01680 [Crocinitomicaceae bacterium]|nr:hypothetical protein [Crocinitomicaceae bacterium]
MNWGKGIAITLALFIGFIMYMVVNMMSTKIDLESDDYYEKEINYSQELNAIGRDKAFAERPTIQLSGDHLLVQLPAEIELTNTVFFLRRPNDENKDMRFDIKGTKTFTLAKSGLEKGSYQVVLSYTIDGEDYMQRRKITI